MNLRSVIFATIVLTLIFSVFGTSFAEDYPGASISVSADKKTVNVGDTVYMTVTATNTGVNCSLTNMVVYISLGGLKFSSASYSGGDSSKGYQPGSSSWPLGNIRVGKKGDPSKTLVLGLKVPSEMAGKTATLSARFKLPLNFYYDNIGDNYRNFYPSVSQASDTITVNPEGQGTGTGTGGGGSTAGSGATSAGDSNTLAGAAQKIQQSGSDGLSDGLTGSDGSGQAYELNLPQKQEQASPYSYLAGILIIVGLVIGGYFYGIRR